MSSSTPAGKAKVSTSRRPSYLHVSDLQGLAQLATQAALGVTGLAENVQGNAYKAVASFFGPLGSKFVDGASGRSGVRSLGMTGLVYGGVRGATRLAGGTVNAVLSGVAPLVGEQVSSRRREAMLAVLNGVLGDRLQDTANPLAIRISLHHEGQALPAQLKRLVFLGTPHHGAPLERQVVTRPFAKIGQIRSAGITDLRYGNVLEADWQHADRFESAPDARQVLPLPAGVSCYAVAANTVAHGVGPLAPVRHALSHKVVGDGLVPLESALGQHEEPRRSLAFAPQNLWIAHGMNHLELLRRPEVTGQLLRWLGQSS